MNLNNFKPHFVVPCWILIVAFLVAAFCFRSLANLLGVLTSFAVLYAIIFSFYFVIYLYIKNENLAKDSSSKVIDLPGVYKDLRVNIFLSKDLIYKDIGIMAGVIIAVFVLLPYLIYAKIHGSPRAGYMPLSFTVGICVYAQARIMFELLSRFFLGNRVTNNQN